MRDSSLLIAIIGAVLVSVCSSDPQSFPRSTEDESVRMASESLVVKSYRDAESSTVSTTKSQAERFEEFQVYQGVMGRPGIDFPVYPQIPATSFSCRGVKKSGYYADLETDCQVFHICDGNRKISFLCPNGTIFRQSHLICDWWFRVDCGKSVELYEESAEQLAADQKVYKARSEEREKRRKLGKAAKIEGGGELTSAEVHSEDDSLQFKTRKPEQNRNHFSSTRATPSRYTFDGRKGERHSKKVFDTVATEKFPNYNRESQYVGVTENIRTYKPSSRQYATTVPVSQEPNTKISFIDNPNTPSAYKSRSQAQNSITSQSNKENIQLAESGSLVEDLNNRSFNRSRHQNFEYNNRDKITTYSPNTEANRNFAYKTQNTESNTNFAQNNQNTEANRNFAYKNQNTESNTNFAQNNQNIEANRNFAYNNQNTESNRNFAQNLQNRETNRNFAYNSQNTGANSNFAQSNQNIETKRNNFQNSQSRETNRNFSYNNQNTEVNSNIAYSSSNNNNNNNKAEQQTHFQSTGFEFSGNQNIDDNSNRNINFSEKRKQQFIIDTSKTNFKGTEETTDIGVTGYTTEYYNYESKRTNPVERQETVTPVFQTRKSQSSRYRSTTPVYVEEEKQFLAETASFGSNRGGKSYVDFQNQFNTFDKGEVTTTTKPYRTTFYTTSKRTETFATTPPAPAQKYNTGNLNFNQDFYRTSTHRPIKQHSRKVTIYPSTDPQTTFASRTWQTTTAGTTFQPYVETTTNEKFTIDDVYFTTSTPDKEVEFITETQFFGNSPQNQTETQTEYDSTLSTARPEVDISLQELNINKTPQPVIATNKSYEDFVREGLEVPPSSGPNAIRSFALYYATTNNDEESRTTAFQTTFPTSEPDITTLTAFEIKKKEVVKEVDELVQKSSVNASEHISHSEELPNSLTLHTQNSYSALFSAQPAENNANASRQDDAQTENFETTAFESFTEEPTKINKELTKNDLDGSQSRGLVEPDPHSDTDYSKVSPDLRELAQVFTKALSAYLDDPEAFRRVLSEIRPTEPTLDSEISSSNPLEYPSATQEDDEVLDFSDVTKSTYKKKTSTVSHIRETTTEYFTEIPTTNANDIDNFVLPVNQSSWATNIELTAPLLESLDQSQSNYYTPPPHIGTTNAIAEEINNEFTGSEGVASTDSSKDVDSYLPIKGSVDDPSLPRYGGFQNNTNPTTKYSPYGAELTSTTHLPFGTDLTPTAIPEATSNTDITTFNPNNVTSFFSHFSKNESEEGEIQLAKELNNLVLLQKFTTPRGSQKEATTPEPNLSTVHITSQNDINHYQDVKLGNGETLEKSVRGGKSLHFPESTITSNSFEPDAKEINLELSPPQTTPKGFLITYSLGSSVATEGATYLPKSTTAEIQPTTYSPGRETTYTFPPETQPPTFNPAFENFSERLERLTKSRTTTEHFTTLPPVTKPIDRLTQLQETLMFNSTNITVQQRDQARVSVEEMMDKMNMTDSTANTLMKVMEMAAKNETYRRLVLLLVNDKSGRNKTVEESRLSLLKALLTPVINPPRTVVPIPETSRLVQTEPRRRNTSRRGKSINADNAINVVRTTTPTTTTTQSRSGRRGKPSRGLTRAESNYNKSGLGNLGVIRRTIENSKNKQVKINSIDDAILDSDSRAVELLRSLYSLAARWG